jgi:hypothetical protein
MKNSIEYYSVKKKKKGVKPSVVTYICNLSTRDAEALWEIVNSRLA